MNNTQKLLNLATKAAENAYAPYSKFHVGAAIWQMMARCMPAAM